MHDVKIIHDQISIKEENVGNNKITLGRNKSPKAMEHGFNYKFFYQNWSQMFIVRPSPFQC